MMTAIVQCPNAMCGHVSHLGQDPLGRIFRCPHCLTKLPAAPASAADSGWTTLTGRHQHRRRQTTLRANQVPRWSEQICGSCDNADQGWKSWALVGSNEVGENQVEVISRQDANDTKSSEDGLGPDDSGEVLILPVLSEGPSDSTWGGTSRSSISTADGIGSALNPIGSHLAPILDGELGRFRVVSVLGQGQHAVVYRAYDPILERDIALKLPRQGVLKTTKAVDRFLGKPKRSHGYGILGLCRCMRRDA